MLVATYSSNGASAFDMVIKPDLVAPGNKLWAYMAAGTTIPGEIPEQYLSTAPDGSPLIAISGTTESPGVVSGVVALMLEASPSLGQGHVKMALQLSAQFLPEGALVAIGSGIVKAT